MSRLMISLVCSLSLAAALVPAAEPADRWEADLRKFEAVGARGPGQGSQPAHPRRDEGPEAGLRQRLAVHDRHRRQAAARAIRPGRTAPVGGGVPALGPAGAAARRGEVRLTARLGL